MTPAEGGGGAGEYSHCAAQPGRDFEARDLERGVSISEAFSRTGYKKSWITALPSAKKLLLIMKKHLFDVYVYYTSNK